MSAFEDSFISCLYTCSEARCYLPILQQPLPSMHYLILHWFVTPAPVESSEVRVCSYSLTDIMSMAILLSVPEPTHVIQPNCLDTVLTENEREPKQSVCFNSTGQRHCIPRNWVHLLILESFHTKFGSDRHSSF